MSKLTPQSVSCEISADLRWMRDPVRAQGVQRYFKHEIAALGIPTPALRALASERARQLRSQWQTPQAVALCDLLVREPELEIRGMGILILGAFRKQLTPELLKRAERWFKRALDNWALTDGFCGAVLSPLLEQYPEVEVTLAEWSRAKSMWLRRAALVTLVPFARRGQRLDSAYRFAREHFADPEDLMHKATGWVLREAGKTDMPRLKRFLLQEGPAIPRTTLRYAIERYSAIERQRLLQATRSSTNTRQAA